MSEQINMGLLSPASRAHPLRSNDLGVALRFTPGFMLSPRFAGSTQTLYQLVQRVGTLDEHGKPNNEVNCGPAIDRADCDLRLHA